MWVSTAPWWFPKALCELVNPAESRAGFSGACPLKLRLVIMIFI
jgi:hypothetical protein